MKTAISRSIVRYGTSKSVGVDRDAVPRTRERLPLRREALSPYALPCSSVPYGWQMNGEGVFVPSQRVARLNIFGMITRDNQYEGFTTTERLTAGARSSVSSMSSPSVSTGRPLSCLPMPPCIATSGSGNSGRYGKRGDSSSSSCHHTPHT